MAHTCKPSTGRRKLENGELKASLGYSVILCLKELEEKVPNTYCVTYTILNAFNIQANKKKIPALVSPASRKDG